jgi:hypothetical protein
MKYVIILSLFLFSCGVQHHINKAKKHTEKAIDKGAIFTAYNDTLYINDTIITERTFTRNDTVFLERIKTIEKVITQSGEIRYITKHDKRVEVREEKKAVKREYKLDKAKEKTKRVISKNENSKINKWAVLFIVLAITVVYLLWRKSN